MRGETNRALLAGVSLREQDYITTKRLFEKQSSLTQRLNYIEEQLMKLNKNNSQSQKNSSRSTRAQSPRQVEYSPIKTKVSLPPIV